MDESRHQSENASLAADVARLSRLVYSREGADPETIAALARAQRELALYEPDLDPAISAAPDSAPTRDEETATAETGELAPNRGLPLAFAIGVTAVVALVGGTWAGAAWNGPKAGPTVTVTASITPTPAPTSAALAVFDRKQVTSGAQSDLPPAIDALAGYTANSFRLISAVPKMSLTIAESQQNLKTTIAKIYAGRDGNEVCAVVISAKKLLASSCADANFFPFYGLDVAFTIGNARYSGTWDKADGIESIEAESN